MKKYIVQTLFLVHLHVWGMTDDQQRNIVIQKCAAQYTRPFTSLELGSGNYSYELAQLFPTSVCVIANFFKNFTKIIRQHIPNLIILQHAFDLSDLHRLGECEHFDLVFCVSNGTLPLGINYLDVLRKLGDNLIIEIDNNNRLAQEYMIALHGNIYASLSLSTIFYLPCNKTCLTRKTWLRTLESQITIKSNFTEKKLIKKTPYHGDILISDWLPGINLITFKMCHGIYPEKETIKHALHSIKYVCHNDWAMHNIIVQGTKLVLIDYKDPRMQGLEQTNSALRKKTYNKIIQCIELDHPDKVEQFYWKHLKTKPTNPVKQFFKRILHRA